jgi:UDP-glucose 4-epimerase
MSSGTVLITGVAGFIGSNLAETMLAKGYSVVGVDNMSQGRVLNIADILQHPRFTLHEFDIRNEAAVFDAAKGCELIVHLAAYKIPRYSDALDTLQINALGTESVAKAAIANGARLVAASTSDVYGKSPAIPFCEDADLVIGNPRVRRWAYAVSKMYSEHLLFALHERRQLDVVILRFFNAYGPNQSLSWWGGPIPVFINNSLEGRPLEIHGDGQQTRCFTYISDHVDGIMRAVENPAANNLVFNLGNVRETSIMHLATLVWRLVRKEDEPAITFVPYEQFGRYEDVHRRIPDISLARDVLGFEPKIQLDEGLRRTVTWQVQLKNDLRLAIEC